MYLIILEKEGLVGNNPIGSVSDLKRKHIPNTQHMYHEKRYIDLDTRVAREEIKISSSAYVRMRWRLVPDESAPPPGTG